MRAVKTVHHPERVRKFSGHKRLVLASLLSIVLMTSIFYVGNPPLTAQSDSGGSSNSFILYIGNATMTNVTMKGPHAYNSLNVTIVTATVVNISGMLLVKEQGGSRVELESPTAFATYLTVYTTYLESLIDFDNWLKVKIYGNDTVYFPFEQLTFTDAYMETVYLQAESFFTPRLSLAIA